MPLNKSFMMVCPSAGYAPGRIIITGFFIQRYESWRRCHFLIKLLHRFELFTNFLSKRNALGLIPCKLSSLDPPAHGW